VIGHEHPSGKFWIKLAYALVGPEVWTSASFWLSDGKLRPDDGTKRSTAVKLGTPQRSLGSRRTENETFQEVLQTIPGSLNLQRYT
jgi:hypothetical protein